MRLGCLHGLCPLNSRAIDKSKLSPSMPYSLDEKTPSIPQAKKLRELEILMKPETVELYSKRFEEGYDVVTDELYLIWSKMKKLSILDNTTSNSYIPVAQQKVSPVMDEVLTYPNPPEEKTNKGKSTTSMPKHLTGQQMMIYMKEKQAAKQKKEEEKRLRKEEREKKRLERERVATKKRRERETEKRSRRCRGRTRRGRGCLRSGSRASSTSDQQAKKTTCKGRGRGRGCGQGKGQSSSSGRSVGYDQTQGDLSTEDDSTYLILIVLLTPVKVVEITVALSVASQLDFFG